MPANQVISWMRQPRMSTDRRESETAHSPCPVTGGWKAHFLSLPARPERGESRREGHPIRECLISPTLSSLLRREEREKRPKACLVAGRMTLTMSGEFSPSINEGEGREEEGVPNHWELRPPTLDAHRSRVPTEGRDSCRPVFQWASPRAAGVPPFRFPEKDRATPYANFTNWRSFVRFA
jgi:hypothetical protein